MLILSFTSNLKLALFTLMDRSIKYPRSHRKALWWKRLDQKQRKKYSSKIDKKKYFVKIVRKQTYTHPPKPSVFKEGYAGLK